MLLKNFLFIAALAALILIINPHRTQAQTETPKVEIGAHFSYLRLQDLRENNPGVGGRITVNLTDRIGLEGEVNLFPQRNSSPFLFVEGRKVQGQFGVKTGLRSDRFGIFAKLRPGFVHFDRLLTDTCLGPVCPAILPIPRSETKFSFDVGGVVEYYPSRHTMLRFDIGNTIIRFSDRNAPRGTTSNLQFSTGFGFRF